MKGAAAMRWKFMICWGMVLLSAFLMWAQHALAGGDPDTTTGQRTGISCKTVTAIEARGLAALSAGELLALGQAYELGECVGQDHVAAYKVYRSAIDRGASVAAVRLGILRLEGAGVRHDAEEARYWFRSYALMEFANSGPVERAVLAAILFGVPAPDMLEDEIERAIGDGNGGSVDVWMRHYRDLRDRMPL